MGPLHRFSDKSLKSAICEGEYIVNLRVLTFLALPNNDLGGLTANRLPIESISGGRTICNDSLGSIRNGRRLIQQFADHFWKRWVKEYASNLTRRGKWFFKWRLAKMDSIVIIVHENLPRNTWVKGVIIDHRLQV